MVELFEEMIAERGNVSFSGERSDDWMGPPDISAYKTNIFLSHCEVNHGEDAVDMDDFRNISYKRDSRNSA